MFATFDSSEWPHVTIVLRGTPSCGEEFEHYLAGCTQLYAAETPITIVIDAEGIGSLDASYMMRQFQYMLSTRATSDRFMVRCGIAAPPDKEALLSPLMGLAGDKVRLFGNCTDARSWAQHGIVK